MTIKIFIKIKKFLKTAILSTKFTGSYLEQSIYVLYDHSACLVTDSMK